MEKTVALYLRVSTKHQDTPEGSLISQEQRLIEWYDYHNSQAKHSKEKDPYSNYVIYKDVETGTKASKRPSYNRMLADIKMGKIHTVAAASISRLNRNLREFYELYDITQQHNVDIFSQKESFDTSTAIGRAILKFMLVFYELESEQTSERGRDNRYARAKRGLWVTSTVTGYKKDPEKPGQLIPIASEVETVNLIFDLYLKHGSISAVKKALDQKGVLTPARKLTGANTGKPKSFGTMTISRILQNKVYIGIQQYQKGKRGIEGLQPGDAYEEIPGNWKAIVEQDKFNQVQFLLIKNKESNTNQVKKKVKVFELSSLIKCGVCKGKPKYTTKSGTSKTKKIYYYYSCPSCKKTFRADILEKEITTILEKLSKNKQLIKRLLKEYDNSYNHELSELKNRLSQLCEEEKEIEKEIQTETEKFSQLEETNLELFKKQALKAHDALKERYDANQNSKLEVEQKISEAEFSEVNPKLLSEILKNLSQILPDLPLLTRKAVLSQVIAQITVFNKKIEVRVGEKIYNINFKKIASTNKKFVEATIERDRRDSNPRPPA
ncbi:MAG: recombinase family protein [Flavobacteriaceae bacterium]|nr:recombinase family protein [Flavobacteriaceae bacterium]